MGARIAWVLNLGGEAELEDPRHEASAAVRGRRQALYSRLGSLVRPGDVVVEDASARGSAGGAMGRAWLPTPRAIATLERAGAKVAPAPPYEVLRAVNDRRFSLQLGPTLPGQRCVTTIDEIVAAFSGPSPAGNWLLRRPHGFAGRGRRRVRVDEVLGAARGWIEASLRSFGALVAEPWVDREADFGLHGYLTAAGALVLGQPTRQEMAPDGAWMGSAPVRPGDLGVDETALLESAVRGAGVSLRAAGYFGPFGVDAFRWRDEHGRLQFNPRCEINARYSMGWAVGMGDERPDRAEDGGG
jgi:hypothetical protein